MSRRRFSREKIARAAVDIACTYGTSKVTMRRVGKALGCEAMSLYTYVSSASDMWLAMVHEVAGPRTAELLEAPLTGDDPVMASAAKAVCHLLVSRSRTPSEVDGLLRDIREADS